MRSSIFKIFSAVFIFLIFGCINVKNNTSEITEYVWAIAQTHPEGFTLNISSKEAVKKGIVVSYLETQNSLGKESIPKVIKHALSHDKIVGGWLNTNDSLYYFDSNKVFPDSLIQEAIEFAIKNRQQSIYDLTNDSIIRINYSAISENSAIRKSIPNCMTN